MSEGIITANVVRLRYPSQQHAKDIVNQDSREQAPVNPTRFLGKLPSHLRIAEAQEGYMRSENGERQSWETNHDLDLSGAHDTVFECLV